MPLFEYADLVWGDKHNLILMSSLQILQNRAAKIILDRPLYSSALHALATLKWIPLEKRCFQRRCVHVYKCLNGLINHEWAIDSWSLRAKGSITQLVRRKRQKPSLQMQVEEILIWE